MTTLILEWTEGGTVRSAQTYQNLILAIEDAKKLAAEDGISDVRIYVDYKTCGIYINLDGTWSET